MTLSRTGSLPAALSRWCSGSESVAKKSLSVRAGISG